MSRFTVPPTARIHAERPDRAQPGQPSGHPRCGSPSMASMEGLGVLAAEPSLEIGQSVTVMVACHGRFAQAGAAAVLARRDPGTLRQRHPGRRWQRRPQRRVHRRGGGGTAGHRHGGIVRALPQRAVARNRTVHPAGRQQPWVALLARCTSPLILLSRCRRDCPAARSPSLFAMRFRNQGSVDVVGIR